MNTININVTNKIATASARVAIVCGNSDYQIKVAFDSEWDAYPTKTARFIWNNQYSDIVFQGDTCPVPIIKNATAVKVGVYAGDLATTTPAYIDCVKSILCGDESVQDEPSSGEAQADAVREAGAQALADLDAAKEEMLEEIEAVANIVQETGDSETQVMSQAATTKAVGAVDAKVAKNAEKISRNDKRITNLEQGLPDDEYQTDDSVAYVKDVPSNALPYAEILKVGGMTYKDGDTLKSAKVTELESIGANLIPFPYLNITDTIERNGITWTLNADRSITANGTTTGDGSYVLIAEVPVTAGTYTLSGCQAGGDWIAHFLYAISKNGSFNSAYDFGEGALITVSQADVAQIYVYVGGEGTTVNNVIYRPMVNKGSTALPFAPYAKRTFPIPEAVQALDGYGEGLNSAYLNVLRLDTSRYIQWARRLSASEKTLQAVDYQYENVVFYQLSKAGTVDLDKTTTNILVSNFPIYEGTQTWDSADRIGTVTGAATYGWYWFGFSIGTTLEEAQAIIDECDILVTLATAEITDISDILTADNFIGVEGNGILTFKNENGYDVPSEVTYMLEEVTE